MARVEASYSGSTRVGKGSTSINLARLCTIRWIVLVFQALALVALLHYTREGPDLRPLSLSMFLMALVNGATQYRFKKNRVISEQEFFTHLLIDVAYLTLILYLAGGSTNPFVSYYLIPLIISAAVLEKRYTWFLAGLTLLLYTGLFFYFQPLSIFTNHRGDLIGSPHFIGMWINFGFSALLICWFVASMAGTLQGQAQAISENRERMLRDEQILGIASLAAGTAHELRTPLSTVSILVAELKGDHPDICAELEVIENQVKRCERKLKDMVDRSRSGSQILHCSLAEVLNPLLESWQLLKPEIQLQLDIEDGIWSKKIRIDQTFDQALVSLLNNAADASPERISLRVLSRGDELELTIEDEGAGISEVVSNDLGKVFISTKEDGLGMGILLSQASIERLGGRVEQFERRLGGLCTRITLPISREF